MKKWLRIVLYYVPYFAYFGFWCINDLFFLYFRIFKCLSFWKKVYIIEFWHLSQNILRILIHQSFMEYMQIISWLWGKFLTMFRLFFGDFSLNISEYSGIFRNPYLLSFFPTSITRMIFFAPLSRGFFRCSKRLMWTGFTDFDVFK